MTEGSISCACLKGDFHYTKLDRVFIGTDDRHAEISVDRCKACGRHWLCYHLELEHISRSGRWYRGLIGPEVAFSHRNAQLILEQLRDYWAGGSHFDGKVHLRSGPLDVD